MYVMIHFGYSEYHMLPILHNNQNEITFSIPKPLSERKLGVRGIELIRIYTSSLLHNKPTSLIVLVLKLVKHIPSCGIFLSTLHV